MRSMRPLQRTLTRPFHPSSILPSTRVSTCVYVYTRFRHGLSPPLPCATSISFRSTRPTVCLNFSRSVYTVAKPEEKSFFLGSRGGCARCMRPRLRALPPVVRLSRHFEIWDMSGWLAGDLYGKIGEGGNLLSFQVVKLEWDLQKLKRDRLQGVYVGL